MRKELSIAILTVTVVGCTAPTPNSFRTGDADYDSVKTHAPVAETRVFVRQSGVCKSLGTSAESLPPLAISALSYIVKEGVAYGKDYLDKQAAYLSADVVLNANAYLTFDKSNAWPNESTAQEAKQNRDGQVAEAAMEARDSYQQAHPKATATDKGLVASVEEAKKAARERYSKLTKIQGSDNDLCVLIVAGEYQAHNGHTKHKEDFTKFSGANTELLDQYRMSVPGTAFNESPKPFDNLSSDPSFIAELHVVPTVVNEKMVYTIKPNYIFYPKPLHKNTANGLERKVMIELGFGTNKPALSFDTLKSGWVYDNDDLISKYVMFEAPINQSYQSISIKVTEGPDKMPTAKMLADLSARDKDLEKYLIDKIESLSAEKAAAKPAAP
ncbi:hypothetical protein [Pseudomonas mandelii]|uniref:hypothetical protein n=1 Tax=Pseudomonas mandelii TaxID=75612 RepID=UPI0003A04D5F|nr:hypothetical protein [Pseudomonas mandelii]